MATVRELVERKIDYKEVDYAEIICNDHHKCKVISAKSFKRKYKNTDVWHEEVIDYCATDINDHEILLSIAL